MADPSTQAPDDLSAPPAAGPVGFFMEDNGNLSSMRLMCFMALFSAIGFALLSLFLQYRGRGGGDGLYFFTGFLGAAFAPKAIQKFAEQKVPIATPPSEPMASPAAIATPAAPAVPRPPAR